MATKKCQICGENSGIYPLCYKHLQEKSKGLIKKCEKCQKWHYTNESCECKIKKQKNETKVKEQNSTYKKIETPNSMSKNTNNNGQGKCILCGKTANNYFFCSECYYKYKDKELLIKITKCNDIEVLDESYEGRYTCKDGHIVKSKSERDIDNYLYENQIPHAYELALPIDEHEEHDLHPDFTLPVFDNGKPVYIEHWGYDENNIKYTKTKKYKIPKYKELGITLICTNEKNDMKDIYTALSRKLKYYKSNTINFNED